MPSKRKNATKPETIPLSKPTKEDIPIEEQLRLINESGLVQKIPRKDNAPDSSEESSDLPDEIFHAILLIIPFSFLYLCLDIVIHQQYAQHPTWSEEITRMVKNVPILSVFIFYSNRHKSTQLGQALLFALSVIAGVCMIYQVNHAAWGVAMQQCPPLGTLWIYTIVQLDLLPAVLSLGVVFGGVRYLNLQITF
ncbi:hypothetical protein FRC02_011103 [Tulasnella sp. 418]|nr:hypothetical protein FRC02_011103 [Tulasnella sp. 418]